MKKGDSVLFLMVIIVALLILVGSHTPDSRAQLKLNTKGFIELPSNAYIHLIEDSLIMRYVENLNGLNQKLYFSAKRYFFYKIQFHRSYLYENLTHFVTYKDRGVIKVAKALTRDCYSNEEKAEVLLYFVHKHTYDLTIEKNTNYVKYPVETMVEQCGDCEDMAILGAALMKAVGIDVGLIYYSKEELESDAGHLALGVAGNFSGYYVENNGKKYFFAETAGTDWPSELVDWKIGTVPYKFKDKKHEFFPIE